VSFGVAQDAKGHTMAAALVFVLPGYILQLAPLG